LFPHVYEINASQTPLQCAQLQRASDGILTALCNLRTIAHIYTRTFVKIGLYEQTYSRKSHIGYDVHTANGSAMSRHEDDKPDDKNRANAEFRLNLNVANLEGCRSFSEVSACSQNSSQLNYDDAWCASK